MFWFYFGMYTLILVVIWGFYMIIRIHALKFENFQTKIKKVLDAMFISLVTLSVLGYISLYVLNIGNNNGTLRNFQDSNNTGNSNIKESLDSLDVDYY